MNGNSKLETLNPNKIQNNKFKLEFRIWSLGFEAGAPDG